MPHDIKGEIAALVRDPQTVFLHWQLTGGADGVAGRWLLRAREVAEGTLREIAVDARAGNHYLDVEPGRTYEFELAVERLAGVHVICRTQQVEVPRDRPASEAGNRAFPPRFAEPLRAARGRHVPGLNYESTALFIGSSRPRAPRPRRARRPSRRRHG